MKKILILLACCALITNILPWSGSGAYCNRDAIRTCHNRGGAWRRPSEDSCTCEITKDSCKKQNGIWYPTAQTCSLSPCEQRGQECWYGVCVDLHAGLENVDVTNKPDAEKDIINRKFCCKLKFPNQNRWDEANSKCIGVDQ